MGCLHPDIFWSALQKGAAKTLRISHFYADHRICTLQMDSSKEIKPEI